MARAPSKPSKPREARAATRGRAQKTAEVAPRRRDAEATRERIQDAALTLIRKKGFDATTMREIATNAHVSLGLAYHYFENKEALALAFYGDHIARHDTETRKALASREGLAERIEAALLVGIDVRSADRPVLLVMARTVLDAKNPISLFSKETETLRARSIALFREVAEVPELDDSLKEPMALALWALHLGVLLRFVHDESPGQKETRLLAEGSARLAAEIATILSLPLLSGLREDVIGVMRQGGLLREGPSPTEPPSEPHGTTPRDAPLDPDDAPLDPARAGRERL
ncbi:MAG: TetR/AcrR family transcriptional regulator [Sandaracinus sp.]